MIDGRIKIAFHGTNACSFSNDFASLINQDADVYLLPDDLSGSADKKVFAAADVIVGNRYDKSLPHPTALKLFHLPSAGYDAVDLGLMPESVTVCNCFGHEQAIAEYVMAALLARHVPLRDADAKLRKKDWAYRSGAPHRAHGEIAGKTIGLLGFGYIGKAIAKRARAFEMNIYVANRSVISGSDLIDRFYRLDDLYAFCGSIDVLVVCLPLAAATTGIVNADAFAAMKPDAVIVNVSRGPIVNEHALYDALVSNRIAGAIIDTWYTYPTLDEESVLPSSLPFHELPNVVMTPHMSGWTDGTLRRRREAIAANINRYARGEPCMNIVRAPRI